MTKFNYLNRKSEGLKLGQIVAKDLRKRCKPATSCKTDGHKDTSPLEIMLEAKNLTDDGLKEIAEGLQDALAQPDTTKVAVLNLARNSLTARSLSYLAQALPKACLDLEELDLSGNDIAIKTDEDAMALEAFLSALKNCRVLMKLSLANNSLGGVKAFEVFAMVYMQQFRTNVVDIEGTSEEYNQTDGSPLLQVADTFRNMSMSPTRRKGSAAGSSSKSRSPTRSSARGLPTVPLIDFSSSSITDPGALWLSYIIPKHNWAIPRLGRHIHADAGILCSYNNESLTAIGSKLLHQAQLVSYDSFSASETNPDQNTVTSRQRNSSPTHRRKTSNTTQVPNTIVKVHHIGHDPVDELESLRKKLQRTIIQDQGPTAVTLWRTALRLLTHVRQIMPNSTSEEELSPQVAGASPTNSVRSAGIQGGQVESHLHNTYASRVVINSSNRNDAILAITDTSDTPVRPAIFRPRKRRDSFSVGSDVSVSEESPDRTLSLDAPIDMSSKAPPKVTMIGPLPDTAWKIILGLLVAEEGILTKRQKEDVIKYGRDRRTLQEETGSRGKADSVQTWKVLEAMGCLSYDELL